MTADDDVSQYEHFYPLLPRWAQEEYRDMIKASNIYLEGLTRGQYQPRTHHIDLPRWVAMADKAARLCGHLLRELSPQAALTTSWRELPNELLNAVGGYGSLNRFRWVLATSATGDLQDIDLLQNFLRRAGRWWGATAMIHRYTDRDPNVSLAIATAPERELMQRTSSQVIRFHWAAEMIAVEICRQVQADPEFATHLTDFTEANIRSCINSAGYYLSMLDAPPIAHHAPGMGLAKHMSIRAGESRMTFLQAVSSTKLEACPWVEFDQGFVPMATTNVLMAMDRSLLTAVEIALWKANVRKEKVDKGELFERVAQQCISQSLAFGGHTLPRECKIRIASDKPDVDVNIANGDVIQIIGEVKAMESSDNLRNADKNFHEQIGKVHEQLTERLNALTDGVPLIDATGAKHYGNADTIGLGIVLHPYGTTLGDPEMMEVVERPHRHWRVATAELHSWILILSAIETMDELRSYMRFRHDLVELGGYFTEECDAALAFLEGQSERLLREFRAGQAACPPGLTFKPMINGIYADQGLSLNAPRPTDWRQWRYLFSAATFSGPSPYDSAIRRL